MEDLSIFTIADLKQMKESALNAYKILQKQMGGIPQSDYPTLKLIHLNELEEKIRRYEEAIRIREESGKARQNMSEPGNVSSTQVKQNLAGKAGAATGTAPSVGPVKVFISYAHADESSKTELIKHLSALVHVGKVKLWHDRALMLGDRWDDAIVSGLKEADIIMLLVSPDSLSSEYINSVELRIAFERCKKNEAILVPVILTDVLWQILEIGQYQVAPKDGIPIDSKRWTSRNEAFLDVVNQLHKVINTINSKKTSL